MPAESFHCICGTLVLVLPGYANLAKLQRRAARDLEETAILVINTNIQPQPAMLNSTSDKKAIVINRPDGFEKRWLWRCNRCKVPWAYELSTDHVEADGMKHKAIYLLVQGLTSTPELHKMVDKT